MNIIETVFEWLLAATLRASVLAVAVLGIQLALRHRLPAAWRHALWLPMLAVLILPVLPEAPFALFPQQAASPAPVVAEMLVETAAPVAIAPLESTESILPASRAPATTPTLDFLAILWLAGAGGVLAAGLIGYHRNMRRIRASATAPDRILQASISEAAHEAGLTRTPRTLVSSAVVSPAVTGFVRPMLLLPAGFPAGFNAIEARLILLHEFSHLKRLDLPLNWLMCILQAMHWFNPLLWFAFARMRADREVACDARVLSIDATDRRAEYGGALLKLQCVNPSQALSLGFVGIFERGSEIKARIRKISAHRPERAAWRLAGASILALLMVFGVTKGQEADKEPVQADDSIPVADQPAPANPAEDPGKAAITEKLNSIILPSLDFEDVSIEDAVDFLRIRAAELDVKEPDAKKRGLNIVILQQNPAPAEAAAPLIRELRLRNVPLGTALKYICEQTNLGYRVDATGVTLMPAKDANEEPALPAEDARIALIRDKLASIIIPSLDFEDTSIEEAVDFLRMRAMELDAKEPDARKKGLNFVIMNPQAAAFHIKELKLKNATLETVLKAICEQTKLRYTVGDSAIVISP